MNSEPIQELYCYNVRNFTFTMWRALLQVVLGALFDSLKYFKKACTRGYFFQFNGKITLEKKIASSWSSMFSCSDTNWTNCPKVLLASLPFDFQRKMESTYHGLNIRGGDLFLALQSQSIPIFSIGFDLVLFVDEFFDNWKPMKEFFCWYSNNSTVSLKVQHVHTCEILCRQRSIHCKVEQ